MFHGKEEQQILQILFDNSPTATLLLDAHGRIVSWNAAAQKLLQTNRTDLFLAPFANLLAPQQKAIGNSIVTQQESSARYRVTIQPSKAVSKTLNLSVLRINGDAGFQGFVVLCQDDTKQLAHPTNQLRTPQNDALFAASPSAMALTDLDGNIFRPNTAFLRLCGYEDDADLTATPITAVLKTKQSLTEILQSVLASGTWCGEATVRRKRKATTHVLFGVNRLDHTTGATPFLMITCTDITAYKTAIHDLRENQGRFQFVLEHSLSTIYKINLRTHAFEYVSPSVQKNLGYHPDDLMAFTRTEIIDRIHPDDRTSTLEKIKSLSTYCKENEKPRHFEFRFRCKDTEYRWVSNTSMTLFDSRHQPRALVGNMEDVTERKRVWDELVKSEERYRVLAETSADGVFTTDALGRLSYVNPAFEKLLGRRKAQILATPLRSYLLEDSIYFLQQIFLDVRKKNEKIENIELDLVAANETIIPIEVNMAPLMKENEFIGVVCTVRDIVQRREIEAELKKNERLKTEFMNIAAHELRSPVTPIKGYLDLILHDPEVNDKIKNWAKISLRNAERLLKLVNDILDVARLDSDTMRFDMEKLDMVELLNEVGEDMRPAIMTKNLRFNLTVPPDLPHILGDKNRLSQVFKNLIGNALKFTDTGSISVHAKKQDTHILITVVDTGIGISKEEIKKIFIKFYQAYTGEDRNNEGTGLGLFISKEIVKKHNGRIWAESEVGKGSSFCIELPFIYKMKVDFHPPS